MIVRSDGCYEYHMTHQDVMDSQNDATRAVLEVCLYITSLLHNLLSTMYFFQTEISKDK